MIPWNRPELVLALTLALVSLASPATAMEIRNKGDQLILSGAVAGDEFDKVQDALATTPAIKIIILRNSPGGDAPTGYQLGALFRERGLHTAVSGYCCSSCSWGVAFDSSRVITRSSSPRSGSMAITGKTEN